MDLKRCKCFRPKTTIVFYSIGCYASAMSLLLAEMVIAFCVTKWLLYGASGADIYNLFLCILMAFIVKNEVEFLYLSREYNFKLIEVPNEEKQS